ncbi:DUF3299 domain-containing protein [Rhizobacter sp. AJA081-3]|jgi:hypothetical protein|uniref:DUF3299 domain-containing protein n=1 Tax=Rhizobacter sp. AJA081-3 TaxID=2753607 RepID=UPI001ADECE21|nr:DUF3299 domain-containing protein [Rhizobacter sp. AJA081-3]QTN24414.1 DUF3299 domain-containing protein [Rhizobacter sp. AJA081-3]
MNRTAPWLIAMALALPGAHAAAQDKPAAKAAAPARAGFPEITWDDLVPKDWDPLKQFKDMNFGVLSDADPRAAAMLKKMRETWDNAPTNNAMDGKAIRIPGYVVPLEEGKSGMTEFLLVPYFGACIHSPPPPSNQIIHVRPREAAKGVKSMDAVWISGTLKTLRSDTFMGASGYRLEAVAIDIYTDKK